MKCSRPFGLVLVTLVAMAYSMPTETTPRSSTTLRDTQKILTNKIMDISISATSSDVLDVRTPPKIRQHLQNKLKQKEHIENSYAGVAIPVDEEGLEEATKKLNFYKIERPTTESGLSTWILLSGQGSSTPTKTPAKSTVSYQNNDEKTKQNSSVFLNNKPDRFVKPIFRKRITLPSTTTENSVMKTSTVASTTTKIPRETSKLTKVKVSDLNKALNKRHNTTSTSMKKPTTTSSPLNLTSTTVTNIQVPTTELNNSTSIDSGSLKAEAKEGEVDLSDGSDTKKKKSSSKRKKNKNRRRKPSEKNGNSTSVARPTKVKKEKPISTQLYNYLSREIMPTVGVGLVGLMVTAGLASYFLYPFGIARRSYDIDRKDKEGNYYYHDNNYSSGMPEEEAIGKVIAGMPLNSDSMSTNSLVSNSHKTPYTNSRYRLVDRKAQIQPQPYEGVVQGSVEDVPLTFDQDKTYNNNYQTLDYSNSDKRFVVGSVPEGVESATPVTVPEHGPRNLKITDAEVTSGESQENVSELRPAFGPRSLRIRRKRSGISNEIDDVVAPIEPLDDPESEHIQKIEKKASTTTEETGTETPTVTTELPTTTTEGFPQKFASFLDLMRDLVHVKARLGLQVLQNVSQSVSRYISKAQVHLDEHIRRSTKKD